MALAASNSALVGLISRNLPYASNPPVQPMTQHIGRRRSRYPLQATGWFYSAGRAQLKLITSNPNIITLRPRVVMSVSAPAEEDPMDDENLANRWRVIHGQNDWAELIHPQMDSLLRSELIRYGEMAQACYEAFDSDNQSLNCGQCKYPESEFFSSLGMDHHIHGGYDVTRYLYAASKVKLPNFFKMPIMWPNKAQRHHRDVNWMGYVAVSNDDKSRSLGRRDITVVWRGSATGLKWLNDLKDRVLGPISTHDIPSWDKHAKVESAFLSLYTDVNDDCPESARSQLLTEINRLVEVYKDEEISITITGHSLGSALAVLCAFDIAESGVHLRPDRSGEEDVHVSVFSFAGPRVGNTRFKERLETMGVKVLRVYNVHDLVPMAPGLVLNPEISTKVMRFTEKFPWTYSHVGTELALDHKDSPFLKKNCRKVQAHNLEALLHLIDGYHGKGYKFELATPRDIALVNKSTNFLKEEYGVPADWQREANKGMVYINGFWKHRSNQYDDQI